MGGAWGGGIFDIDVSMLEVVIDPSIPFIKHRQNQFQMSKLSVNEQKTKYEEKGRDARKSRRGWWQQLDESPSDATASSCAPSSLHSLPLPPASEFKFQRVCSSLGRCRGRWGNVLQSLQQGFCAGSDDRRAQVSPDLSRDFPKEALRAVESLCPAQVSCARFC